MSNTIFITTLFGHIHIHANGTHIQAIELSHRKVKKNITPDTNSITFSKVIVKQIREYLEHKRTAFDLPYMLPVNASEFQKKVWSAIIDIPYGTTVSYGDLAMLLNSSPRAVGNACGKNAIPLIIPCHRVVSKLGIGGFSGATNSDKIANVRIKKYLLDLEQS
ncbi:MAG: methylated-DNA--[protein]-cysteine S-methyltransferase [Methylacidiphilales bacterium]|nr:methylated-DNA--[protein]-cysteine S-methyltransferase [Candidatus Methylacidiphilales bacterium]